MTGTGPAGQRPRALVVDPTCIHRTAHSGKACRLFGAALAVRGYDVRYVIPVHSITPFHDQEPLVERLLPYPYRAFAYGCGPGEAVHGLDHRLEAIARQAQRRGRRLRTRLHRALADGRIQRHLDGFLRPWLDGLKLGPADLLLMPSADHYVAAGLLRWLERQRHATAPRLLLRFVGVVEWQAVRLAESRVLDLVAEAEELVAAGHRVGLGAETAVYARHLELRGGGGRIGIQVVPFPPRSPPPPRAGAATTVSFIGLRRPEQGPGEVLPLLEALSPAARQALRFVAQQPRDDAGLPADYAARLAGHGVRLHASQLDDEALAAALDEAAVTVLPYDPQRYRLRGSAMLFEAADHGHKVLATAGCAFAPEVAEAGLGRLCAGRDDFIAALEALAGAPETGEPRHAVAARYNAQRERRVAAFLDG